MTTGFPLATWWAAYQPSLFPYGPGRSALQVGLAIAGWTKTIGRWIVCEIEEIAKARATIQALGRPLYRCVASGGEIPVMCWPLCAESHVPDGMEE